MSWNSDDPNFNLTVFFDHLRATKPPYRCPFSGGCQGRVYKTLAGIQDHVDKTHKEQVDLLDGRNLLNKNAKKNANRKPICPGPFGDNDDDDEYGSSASSAATGGTSASAAGGQTPMSVAQAQKMVDVELEGRVWRLNIMEPIGVTAVNDDKLAPDAKATAVLNRYAQAANATKVVLPEGKVSDVKNSPEPKTPFKMPNARITFARPSSSEIDKTVEYDMDEEDYAWLQLLNDARKKCKQPHVSEENFELVMDRLEKECHFQTVKTGMPVKPPVDQDAVCCVCLECYGVPYIPEGQWLCRRCQLSPSATVDCALCPNKGGAFKQTADGKWVHVICAIWVPEVHFANTVFLEPVEGLATVPPGRWKLKCIVCKQKGVGACIQCHKPSCYTAFHVTCAQSASMYMKVQSKRVYNRRGEETVSVSKFVYCDLHAPADDELEDGENGDDTSMLIRTPNLKALQEKKRKQKLRMKQARKKLAQSRDTAPSLSIPVIPRDRLESVASQIQLGAKGAFIEKVLAYWTLKRQARAGVPLIRRLQVYHHSRSTTRASGDIMSPASRDETTQLMRLRRNLERVRILCELVRKREKLKREHLSSCEELVETVMKPPSAVMQMAIEKLIAKDRMGIFTQPVSEETVPGYRTIIKKPMDLSTMRAKLGKGAYKTASDIRDDFKLMIDNCALFNKGNRFFWTYGQRFKRIGTTILRAAEKEEADRTGSTKTVISFLKDAANVSILSAEDLRASLAENDDMKHVKIEELNLDLDRITASAEWSQILTGDGKKKPGARKRKVSNSGEEVGAGGPARKRIKKGNVSADSLVQSSIKRFLSSCSASAKKSTKLPGDDDDDDDRGNKQSDGDDNDSDNNNNNNNNTVLSVKAPKRKRNSSKSLPTPTAAVKAVNKVGSGKRRNTGGGSGSRLRSQTTTTSRKTVAFSRFREGPKSPLSRVSTAAEESSSTALSDEEDEEDQQQQPTTSNNDVRRTKRKRRRTKRPPETVEIGFDVSSSGYEPGDQVWVQLHSGGTVSRAKYVPALIVNPNAKSQINAAGDPLPDPPDDVLAAQPIAADDPHFLLLLFDNKRSWHWMPVSKMEHFGLDFERDAELCDKTIGAEAKRVVEQAYEDAMFYRWRLTAQAPDHLIERLQDRAKEAEEAEASGLVDGNARCTVT